MWRIFNHVLYILWLNNTYINTSLAGLLNELWADLKILCPGLKIKPQPITQPYQARASKKPVDCSNGPGRVWGLWAGWWLCPLFMVKVVKLLSPISKKVAVKLSLASKKQINHFATSLFFFFLFWSGYAPLNSVQSSHLGDLSQHNFLFHKRPESNPGHFDY